MAGVGIFFEKGLFCFLTQSAGIPIVLEPKEFAHDRGDVTIHKMRTCKGNAPEANG